MILCIFQSQGDEKFSKFGNIVQAKAEMGMTAEQKEEQKVINMEKKKNEKPDFGSMSTDDLRAKLKEIHALICNLEAEKYDMEAREARQDYDVSRAMHFDFYFKSAKLKQPRTLK